MVDRQEILDSLNYEIGGLRIIPSNIIGADDINSKEDAENVYKYICSRLKYYKLDGLLLKIHDDFLNYQLPVYSNFTASMAKFVLQNSSMYGEFGSISNDEFIELFRMIISYELYDPEFSKDFRMNPKRTAASYVLKSLGQLQWHRNIRFMLSRTMFLYEELIKDDSAPEFIKDVVGSEFEKIFGLPLHDFIKIGAVLWAGSSSHKGGLRRDYLEIARSQGMTIPDDETVKICLRLIVCDPLQFRTDPLFKKYNINPLLNRPLVRLWEKSGDNEPFDDKFIAPIPDMIIYRITIGIYYQLFNIYGLKFATSFGDLFELYVGKIINGLALPSRIIAEKDIDSFLPTKGRKGAKTKRPDWIIFSDNGVILIECKAMHYTQDTFEHGIDAKNTGWLEQIRKSLDQFDQFERQIPTLCKKLGLNYPKLNVQRIIISFEPLLGLKKGPLRDFIDGKNKRDWILLPVEDLEEIQPYIANGYDLWSFILEYKTTLYEEFPNIIKKMQYETCSDGSDNMFSIYRTRILYDLLMNVERKRETAATSPTNCNHFC